MHPAKNFRNHINFCKRSAVSPHEIHRVPFLSQDKRFLQVYETYEKALAHASAFDFESLLLETYKLMNRERDFLNRLSNQFQFIFVDEYQDTNHIQYLLIKKLGQKNKNVCVVGDEDQSIYGWRGANISHILNFEKDFSGCKTFFLERNYRSTKKHCYSRQLTYQMQSYAKREKTLYGKRHRGKKFLSGKPPMNLRKVALSPKELNTFVKTRGPHGEIFLFSTAPTPSPDPWKMDFAFFKYLIKLWEMSAFMNGRRLKTLFLT